MTVYQKLQNICKEKGISITSLCLQSTGNKGNLQTWKNNDGYMRSDYLSKCADLLECSTDYILGRTDLPTVFPIKSHKTEQEKALFDIFKKLDVINQAKLLAYAAELEKGG